MITIIDENNIVTEDGVELVSKLIGIGEEKYCIDCYLSRNSCCNRAPCELYERSDDRDVIFVEKNPC